VAGAAQAVLIHTITALQDAGLAISWACRLLGVPRSTYYRLAHGYRHYQPVAEPVRQADRRQPSALDPAEIRAIIDVLSSEEYAEKSVVQTYWAAFDAGEVACSQRTFYRVAKTHRLVGDRRRSKRHAPGSRTAPVVAASSVGQLWSWDVTELRGPRRERYFLYLVIDVFSRFPVGWCIEHEQTTAKALTLFAGAVAAHGAPEIVHADNGAIQRAHDLIDALHENGVLASYSRPRVSDDNPFSESLFKTIKYDPACPDLFDSISHARAWTKQFLHRYATEHRHSGLGRHTPASVHDGTAAEIHRERQRRLDEYWKQHPKRFRTRPRAPQLPRPTGINTHLLSQTA
jgi:putative transposase